MSSTLLTYDLFITHSSVVMNVIRMSSKAGGGKGGSVMGSVVRVLVGTLVGGLGVGVGAEFWRYGGGAR